MVVSCKACVKTSSEIKSKMPLLWHTPHLAAGFPKEPSLSGSVAKSIEFSPMVSAAPPKDRAKNAVTFRKEIDRLLRFSPNSPEEFFSRLHTRHASWFDVAASKVRKASWRGFRPSAWHGWLDWCHRPAALSGIFSPFYPRVILCKYRAQGVQLTLCLGFLRKIPPSPL